MASSQRLDVLGLLKTLWHIVAVVTGDERHCILSSIPFQALYDFLNLE
jgi:hypothetical protein